MPAVTKEMKVLIAASAAQLTYGLPKVKLRHFTRILVYPDNYYSKITRQHHKGEVNPSAKLIVLSWRGFAEGYQNNTDGRNLGLHEMAHALRLENTIRNGEQKFLDPAALVKFDALGEQERQKIKDGGSSLFREYAAENADEFFAVAVELFFEQPAAFQAYQPALYALLTILLKQDALKLAN